MDRNQLLTFERVVREGSFTRAARTLNLSQATISGRIAALEAEIGGPLFVRGGRVTLTQRGEAFLPYARRALAVLAEGVEAARQAHTGQHGRVMVGAIDSVTDGLLVPVVARFRAAHPRVLLSIRTGHTPQIVRELTDGIVRLGLVTWQYMMGTADVEVLVRFREPLVGVVAPSHRLAARAPLSVEQFVRESDPYHETIWGTPEDARIAPTSGRGWEEHEMPHGLMRQLIVRGIGAGFLPVSLVKDDLAAGRLIAPQLTDGGGIERELAFVHLAADGLLSTAGSDFVAAVRAEVALLSRA